MKKLKETTETSKDFLRLMQEWQALEDKSITSANELLGRTDNPLLRMTMEMIRHDSEKHKVVQQMIIDNLTKEAVHLGPDELQQLSGILNNHAEAEAKSLALADEALKNSELFITRYLLSYLLADEAKHHGMLNQLNDLKRASVSTSTSARTYGQLERPPSTIERAHATDAH